MNARRRDQSDSSDPGSSRGSKTRADDVAAADDRLSEEDPADSEARFRSIFEHSNDAIFLMDPGSDAILDANPQAERMLGYSRKSLLQTPVSAIHPDEMPELTRFADSVLRDGHGWTNELTCTTRSGDSLPAEISAAAIQVEGRACLLASVHRSVLCLEDSERHRALSAFTSRAIRRRPRSSR